jgi:quinoprotein glucose dehydrogenase
MPSNLRFRISDLSCAKRKRDSARPQTRIRPISKFALLLCFVFLAHAQDPQRTVWDGVYNEGQAQRGKAAFLSQCSNCHGRDLEGADMTPALTGGAFMANWDSLTVGDLADRIRISMPLNAPGSVSRQDTADIVAYILQFNQFPVGKEELPREVQAMKQILFKASQQ